jgi:hypothetical protein
VDPPKLILSEADMLGPKIHAFCAWQKSCPVKFTGAKLTPERLPAVELKVEFR